MPDRSAGLVFLAPGIQGRLQRLDGSGQAGDVWACDYGHAWDLAAGLRQAIIAVYRHEAANAARAGIAGKVYDYFATGGFEARPGHFGFSPPAVRPYQGKDTMRRGRWLSLVMRMPSGWSSWITWRGGPGVQSPDRLFPR